jgi:hypothetical protein
VDVVMVVVMMTTRGGGGEGTVHYEKVYFMQMTLTWEPTKRNSVKL